MEAVVLAAGEGRRLRPLTERWAKPVLPIDGRPVIGTLMRELADAGMQRATVVTGHLAEQVESLLGDGSAFGIEIRFARQPRRDGSADALARALAAGAEPPFLITAADTVYTPGDVGRFADAFASSDAAGAIAGRRGLVPSAAKPGLAVADGRVVKVFDLDPGNELTSAPLWALRPALRPFLERLPGPPFELRDGYQRAVDAGEEVLAVEIRRTRDLTSPVDLVVQNFPYLAS